MGTVEPRAVRAAADRLLARLSTVDVDSLPISDYNKRYLGNRMKRLAPALSLYSRLVGRALAGRPEGAAPVVDYGGGIGLMSLLLAEGGWGPVVYADIYATSCRDVQVLAEVLGLKLDLVLCGDVDLVVDELVARRIPVGAVVSFDVLEHIYDPLAHFRHLLRLATAPLVVHGSGANIRNPRIVKVVERKQRQVEWEDREAGFGHKDRDSLRSYRALRREHILSRRPDLDPVEVESLVDASRGLIYEDIDTLVREHAASGQITRRPDHPTNTCDPATGNWCERFMDQAWLVRELAALGFTARVAPGPFDVAGWGPKSLAKRLANVGMAVSGTGLMSLAPYFVLEARRAGPAT